MWEAAGQDCLLIIERLSGTTYIHTEEQVQGKLRRMYDNSKLGNMERAEEANPAHAGVLSKNKDGT